MKGPGRKGLIAFQPPKKGERERRGGKIDGMRGHHRQRVGRHPRTKWGDTNDNAPKRGGKDTKRRMKQGNLDAS